MTGPLPFTSFPIHYSMPFDNSTLRSVKYITQIAYKYIVYRAVGIEEQGIAAFSDKAKMLCA